MKYKLATAISHVVDKYHHSTRWQASAVEEARALGNLLPSGSGINGGTKINLSQSRPARLVLDLWFQHYDQHGGEDRVTHHTVVVAPAFGGIEVRVTGRDRNGIKAYLAEVYAHDLAREVETRFEDGALTYALVNEEEEAIA